MPYCNRQLGKPWRFNTKKESKPYLILGWRRVLWQIYITFSDVPIYQTVLLCIPEVCHLNTYLRVNFISHETPRIDKDEDCDPLVTSCSGNTLTSCSFEASHCFLLHVRSVRFKTDCTFTKSLQFSGGLRLRTGTWWSWAFCSVWINDVTMHSALQQGLTSHAVTDVLHYYTIYEHFMTRLPVWVTYKHID